jgi:hypothetical protein
MFTFTHYQQKYAESRKLSVKVHPGKYENAGYPHGVEHQHRSTFGRVVTNVSKVNYTYIFRIEEGILH